MTVGSPVLHCARTIARPLRFVLLLALVAGCASTPPASTVRHLPAADDAVITKVALIDFAPQLGELDANIAALRPLVAQAFDAGVKIVVAPELATTGYSITAQQVLDGLGLRSPFSSLAPLGDLAASHGGYLMLGIAEISADGQNTPFNSVVLYGPDGLIGVQRKRGIALWNSRGDIPFRIFPTPFGDLATIICSDSYLQDWIRIVTLEGADIVLTPANWWGESGQVGIWQSRAQENGIWMLVANRWGTEVDHRFDPPYTYDMNDSPTAVITPTGTVEMLYRPDRQPPPPTDQILYYEVSVPRSRIGGSNPTYSVANRRPSAYPAIANPYYRPDRGNRPYPNLPPAGDLQVALLAYRPSDDGDANLAEVKGLLGTESARVDVVGLPGLGITAAPVACDDSAWARKAPWSSVQALVDTREISLLVTSAWISCPRRLALAVFRNGEPAQLRPQIHGAWGMPGSGEPPLQIDLAHARVALLTGVDSLFPETATQIAKMGTDLVVVASIVADPDRSTADGPVGWTADDLVRTWTVRTNQCFDLLAADAGGHGVAVESGCYVIDAVRVGPTNPVLVWSLSTTDARKKTLNAYYPFDLDTLLGD